MSDHETTVELPVTGMTCASCVARVERAIGKSQGVDKANVNLATEKATVTFDPGEVSTGDLVAAIEGAGYGVVTAQETLPIIGMTCASCVSRVEKALRNPPGVLKADVNLATEKATVTYIPGQASYRDLVEAVRGAGYDVVEPAPGTGEESVEAAADAEEAARAAAYRKLKLKVIVGFVLSVIIFAGTMQMEWFTFLPSWMNNGYFLWALASVVQFWVGRQFYTTAWSALKHGTTTMNTLVAMGSSAAYLYSVAGVLFPGFFEHQGMSGADVLRLRRLHHHADPARAAARGARQGADRSGHQGPHRPAAQDGARHPRRRRDRRAGRPGAGRRPRRRAPRREGAGGRHASRRARRRWTRSCSPASPSPWASTRATRSSAPP